MWDTVREMERGKGIYRFFNYKDLLIEFALGIRFMALVRP